MSCIACFILEDSSAKRESKELNLPATSGHSLLYFSKVVPIRDLRANVEQSPSQVGLKKLLNKVMPRKFVLGFK